MDLNISLGDLIALGGFIAGVTATIITTQAKVNKVYGVMHEWINVRLPKLKVYIETQLNKIDAKYDERIRLLEKRVTMLEKNDALIQQAQKYTYKHGSKEKGHNANKKV